MRRAERVGWLLAVVLVLAAAACGNERERPFPTTPTTEPNLTVELIEPPRSEAVLAGTLMAVRVRAREPSGRLALVGFYAHLLTQSRPVVDSAVVGLTGTADTIVAFDFTVPDTLPNDAQIRLTGIAGSSGSARVVSEPRTIIIVRCPAGATLC